MTAGCHIAAENCIISSETGGLGVQSVADDDDHESARDDDELVPGLASMHGCTFSSSTGGVSLAGGASADEIASLLNANTFQVNAGRSFERNGDGGQGVQPWRRGWAGEL
jgi:hypothetical protein